MHTYSIIVKNVHRKNVGNKIHIHTKKSNSTLTYHIDALQNIYMLLIVNM